MTRNNNTIQLEEIFFVNFNELFLNGILKDNRQEKPVFAVRALVLKLPVWQKGQRK